MGAPEDGFDRSRSVRMHGAVQPPPAAIMPFANGPLTTLAADGFTAASLPDGDFALVAIGNSTMGTGLHIAMNADELRTTATGLLQAADFIDGGKGKQ